MVYAFLFRAMRASLYRQWRTVGRSGINAGDMPCTVGRVVVGQSALNRRRRKYSAWLGQLRQNGDSTDKVGNGHFLQCCERDTSILYETRWVFWTPVSSLRFNVDIYIYAVGSFANAR